MTSAHSSRFTWMTSAMASRYCCVVTSLWYKGKLTWGFIDAVVESLALAECVKGTRECQINAIQAEQRSGFTVGEIMPLSVKNAHSWIKKCCVSYRGIHLQCSVGKSTTQIHFWKKNKRSVRRTVRSCLTHTSVMGHWRQDSVFLMSRKSLYRLYVWNHVSQWHQHTVMTVTMQSSVGESSTFMSLGFFYSVTK